jgi:hypothetical protein
MTPCTPENTFSWLIEWSLVAIRDSMMPPRDPNDDEDEEEEDEEDEDGHEEPAVIREPEPDELATRA